jgi:hypothetical protein
MTQFCLFEGTRPSKGRMDTLRRTFTGSPNDVLTPFIESDDLRGLTNAMKAWKGDINDPVKVVREVNSTWTFWRTPLELAIDEGSSSSMVAYLIDQGALITPPAMKLAINGALKDWDSPRKPREFENAEAIIAVLSKSGAPWEQSFYESKDVYDKRELTILDVIGKLGVNRAASIGLTEDMKPSPRPSTPTRRP